MSEGPARRTGVWRAALIEDTRARLAAMLGPDHLVVVQGRDADRSLAGRLTVLGYGAVQEDNIAGLPKGEPPQDPDAGAIAARVLHRFQLKRRGFLHRMQEGDDILKDLIETELASALSASLAARLNRPPWSTVLARTGDRASTLDELTNAFLVVLLTRRTPITMSYDPGTGSFAAYVQSQVLPGTLGAKTLRALGVERPQEEYDGRLVTSQPGAWQPAAAQRQIDRLYDAGWEGPALEARARGLTVREAADALGVPEKSVSSRTRRERNQARRILRVDATSKEEREDG